MCERDLELEPLGLAGMLQHMIEINRSLHDFPASIVIVLYGVCLV